jgi:hypothetical protein
MEIWSGLKGLNFTNSRIEGLMADFSGMDNLRELVSETLHKLVVANSVQSGIRLVKSGHMSLRDFDGWFGEIVTLELRNTLGVLRNKAIQKALSVGAYDAAYSILRRTYKDGNSGNINIAGNRKRISSRKRLYTPGTQKKRSVSDRTRDLNEYYGPDRSFILRFFEGGTDVRTAKNRVGPSGRGSGATYGARGSMGARSFFAGVHSDMELAAQQLGRTLTEHVKSWIETEFK